MARLDPARTPVLVASGQAVERAAPASALDMAERAVNAAFDQVPKLVGQVDRLTVVDIVFSPVGPSPATELAKRLKWRDVVCERSTGGGNAPQYMVSRAAQDIVDGKIGCCVIAGAEAVRSAKLSGSMVNPVENAVNGTKQRERTGQERSSGNGDVVVGMSPARFIQETEGAGLDNVPGEMFTLVETALMRAAGRDYEEQRTYIGRFFSKFSAIAEQNPYAHARRHFSPSEISEVTTDNRITCEPYTKYMNAFPYVDQGAAVVVTSLETARKAGLEDRCVFFLSGCTGEELDLITKPKIEDPVAMRLIADAARKHAHVDIDDVAHIDLYSCFPVSVQMLADALGVSVSSDRQLTLTGGLPFFGGPGNNYSLHGIAEVHDRILDTGGLGLVYAMTGWVGKGSIGIYSAKPGQSPYQNIHLPPPTGGLAVARDAEGRGFVEAGTVVYARDGSVAKAPIIATLDDGRRIAAQSDPGQLAELAGRVLVGQHVHIRKGFPARYRI